MPNIPIVQGANFSTATGQQVYRAPPTTGGGRSVGQRVKELIFGTPKVAQLISPLGGARAGASFLSRGVSGARAFLARQGIGGTSTTMAQKLRNVLGFGTATALGSYAVTGEVPEPTLRSVALFSAGQFNPLGAIVGAGTGTSKKAIEYFEGRAKTSAGIPPAGMSTQLSAFQDYTAKQIQALQNQLGGYKDTFVGTPPISFMFDTPTAPSVSYTAPSVNVQQPSSGIGDILPLLLLLGGGALAGYGVYRAVKKRRRKKRYKKRRRQ